MQRDPRMLEVLPTSLACPGMTKRSLAVFKCLALQAVRAHRSRGNNHPPGVPPLNPPFTVHAPSPFAFVLES
jgi:hypothetical protein